jgi:iron complex outermembrane receptor protein
VHSTTVLRGTVTDDSTAAIPNASVVLEDDQPQAVGHANTDQEGHYSMMAPVSGTYRVTITAAGFSTLIFENLQLTGSDLTLPNATLRIGNPTETIYVSAAREFSGGQVATESRVGIFGEQSVLDVPFSVHSYTGTFLQNQQALTLTDLLDSDASVVSDPSSSKASPWNDTFQSRGFLVVTDKGLAINGLFGLYGGLPNMEFVERADVFNGPSAFVMGAPESVGGVVNLAPKRAAERPFLSLEPSYLGKSVYGGHIDASDRFGPRRVLGARVNGMYRDGEGEIRDSRLLNAGAAVGADYRSKMLLLSLDAQYIRNYNQAYQYVVIPGQELPVLPSAMPANLSTEPTWMYASISEKIILGRIDLNLSPNWTLTTASGSGHSGRGYPVHCVAIFWTTPEAFSASSSASSSSRTMSAMM